MKNSNTKTTVRVKFIYAMFLEVLFFKPDRPINIPDIPGQ